METSVYIHQFKPGDKVHAAVNMAVHKGIVLEALAVQSAAGLAHYYCVHTKAGIFARVPVAQVVKTKREAAKLAVEQLNTATAKLN